MTESLKESESPSLAKCQGRISHAAELRRAAPFVQRAPCKDTDNKLLKKVSKGSKPLRGFRAEPWSPEASPL